MALDNCSFAQVCDAPGVGGWACMYLMHEMRQMRRVEGEPCAASLNFKLNLCCLSAASLYFHLVLLECC